MLKAKWKSANQKIAKVNSKGKATTQIPERENIANNGSHYNPTDSSVGKFATIKLLKINWTLIYFFNRLEKFNE